MLIDYGEQYVIFVTEDRSFHEEVSLYENPFEHYGCGSHDEITADKIRPALLRSVSDIKQALVNARAVAASKTGRWSSKDEPPTVVGRSCFGAQFYAALAPGARIFHGRRVWFNRAAGPAAEEPFTPIENAKRHTVTIPIIKVYLKPSGWDVEVGFDTISGDKTPEEKTLRTITKVLYPRTPVDDLVNRLIAEQEQAQPGKTPEANTEILP